MSQKRLVKLRRSPRCKYLVDGGFGVETVASYNDIPPLLLGRKMLNEVFELVTRDRYLESDPFIYRLVPTSSFIVGLYKKYSYFLLCAEGDFYEIEQA